MADRELRLWQQVVEYLNRRRQAGVDDSLFGQVGGEFTSSRRDLIGSVARAARDVVDRYDERAQAAELAAADWVAANLKPFDPNPRRIQFATNLPWQPQPVPMIDVFATEGTFADKHTLAQDLAKAVMRWEKVPELPLFFDNTAAFIHDLPDGALSNVEGDGNYVRVQVLTNAGALNREKQLAVVRQFTDLVAVAAGDPSLTARTWVLLTESPEGGWGIAGHANTNADIATLARAALEGR